MARPLPQVAPLLYHLESASGRGLRWFGSDPDGGQQPGGAGSSGGGGGGAEQPHRVSSSKQDGSAHQQEQPQQAQQQEPQEPTDPLLRAHIEQLHELKGGVVGGWACHLPPPRASPIAPLAAACIPGTLLHMCVHWWPFGGTGCPLLSCRPHPKGTPACWSPSPAPAPAAPLPAHLGPRARPTGSTRVQQQTLGREQHPGIVTWVAALVGGWVQNFVDGFIKEKVEKSFTAAEFLEGAKDAYFMGETRVARDDWWRGGWGWARLGWVGGARVAWLWVVCLCVTPALVSWLGVRQRCVSQGHHGAGQWGGQLPCLKSCAAAELLGVASALAKKAGVRPGPYSASESALASSVLPTSSVKAQQPNLHSLMVTMPERPAWDARPFIPA